MEDNDVTSDSGWDLEQLSLNLKWESEGMETFCGDCHELELLQNRIVWYEMRTGWDPEDKWQKIDLPPRNLYC